MTKQTLIFIILATSLAVGGCTTAPEQQAMPQSMKDSLIFPPPPEQPRFIYERTLKGSPDVIPDAENDALRRALTGEKKRGEGLGKPYGVAVHHGRVFVGDSGRRNVMVFDIPEQKFFVIGEEEPGQLARPLGIDVDKDGNLFVLDGINKVVFAYNRDGKYLRTIGSPLDFTRPAGLAVNADGSRVYAVDIGGSSSDNHKIIMYDGQSGAKLSEIGKRGTKEGELNLPRDVTVAPDGSLYVVDGGNFRVQKFTADGTFISTFGSVGRQGGQFSRPKEAALDKDGNIYVADAAFGNFQIFNPQGQLLLAIGNRSDRGGPAKFMLPSGIAVDSDGRIYFVDQFFQKVDVFRPYSLTPEQGYTNKDNRGKYIPTPDQPAK